MSILTSLSIEPARKHLMELSHSLEVLGHQAKAELTPEEIGELALFAEDAKGYLNEFRTGVDALVHDAYCAYYAER